VIGLARTHVGAGTGALALAVACALAACATTTAGNGRLVQLDAAGANALLVPGRSTQAEVAQALGQGTVIRFGNGYETWHYIYRQGPDKGWDDVTWWLFERA